MRLLLATALLMPLLAAAARPSADAAYRRIEGRYVREFLRRHPVVSTYLGGSGLHPELARADGALRDWSPAALAEEAGVYREVRAELERLDPRRLSPRHRGDRQAALHQIAFMLRQDEERKYWRRALDTYVNEAFRGVDWFLQGMGDEGQGRYGAEAEWRTVAARVGAVPAYLAVARSNLQAGIAAGDVPDWRMVERDGLATSEENAKYFETTLPGLAVERTRSQPFADSVVAELKTNGAAAAVAFRGFCGFVERSLATLPRTDRFVFGEKEYDWALRNNLRVASTAAELFAKSWPIVQKTRDELMATARVVAEKNARPLPWDDTHREAS